MRMPAHHRLPLLPFLDVSELRDTGINKMNDLTAKGLADRTQVGVMSIGRHPLWSVAYHIGGLLEKRLAASISRFSLTIESTGFPSRSMAR